MKITTFLMFQGQAEAAMTFYVSLFERSRIASIRRYGPGEAGKEGTVQVAIFELNGEALMCIDSPVEQPFCFNPAISLFVSCDDEEETDRLFAALSEGGEIKMPLQEYPFARRFAWVQDRFGVSWQLNLR
ncbi:MAG: VOC family protein [Moraxellaceae bacterium]|nr:VOC family protein [Moraxellaceae bacterium]